MLFLLRLKNSIILISTLINNYNNVIFLMSIYDIVFSHTIDGVLFPNKYNKLNNSLVDNIVVIILIS